MIETWKDADAKLLFLTGKSKRFPASIRDGATKKLLLLNGAAAIEDLRVPPGNRLEALRGDRAGQHSIRINDQYRICFTWMSNNAHDVEIVDYH
jgi:proteic killer suppression protein